MKAATTSTWRTNKYSKKRERWMAEGKLSIQFPAESAKHDLRYRIEARVTDQANREVSGTGIVLATRAPFYLNAQPEHTSMGPAIRRKSVSRLATTRATSFPMLSFRLRFWQTSAAGSCGASTGRTGANGVGTADVRLTSGVLIARVSAKTADGREVDDDAYLWVSGGDASSYERQQRVEIIPDKKSYARGEVAKLLIVTGVPNASVWITAETGGILTSRLWNRADQQQL